MQDMTPKAVTVYRRRTCHPKLSQYTDTGHDTKSCHSIQTQDMTPKLSQYTDTGHDTQSCHSIQTQDMTPKAVTNQRNVACKFNTLSAWPQLLPLLFKI